jgi:hypothetical protein
MEQSLNQAAQLFTQFRGLFDQPNPALEQCKQLMTKLKVCGNELTLPLKNPDCNDEFFFSVFFPRDFRTNESQFIDS